MARVLTKIKIKPENMKYEYITIYIIVKKNDMKITVVWQIIAGLLCIEYALY